MILKKSVNSISLIKLIVLPLVFIVFAVNMLFLSFMIQTSALPEQISYYFIICSQIFYILLVLFYGFKLFRNIFQKYSYNKISNKSVLETNILLRNENKSINSIIRNAVLTSDVNCEETSQEKCFLNENNIFNEESIYEHMSLPIIVTNNKGIVLKANILATELFNKNLINEDIKEYVEVVDINNISHYNIVNIKLHEHNKDIINSVLLNNILDDNQELKLVIFVFLPMYIPSNLVVDKISKLQIDQINENRLNYEEIINILNIGLFIVDKEHKIVWLNNKMVSLLNIINQHNNFAYKDKVESEALNHKSINYSKEKLLDNNFKSVFADILDKTHIKNILNTKQGINYLLIKQDVYIEIQHTAIKDNILITIMDISEKRKLELQNSFSQRLQTIGQIASAVAHDFNNLLTAIMSFTYFLKERSREEDPSLLEIEQIEQNANRAKVMIRQLLTFSRSTELYPVEFLVNSEISNLMSTILRLMGERIKTEFLRGKNIGKITMDPVQFQQVIINLVVNARDAMKNGGKLVISTNLVQLKQPQEAIMSTIPPGDYIVVSVVDQGEGIKKENFKKIFQTHFSTKGDKGNGLGLSTVAKIMQENSGFISLESTLNQGTSFHLYFAVDKVNLNKEDSEEQLIVLQNNKAKDITLDLTGRETILLVEDEIPVRMVCKRALVNKGYSVIEAEDAESALTLLQNLTNKVDLIISDIMMPGMSGLEFILAARKIHPELKAILMSGYAEDTLDINHYALDSIEFLAKPFSPDVLATKVKKVINN